MSVFKKYQQQNQTQPMDNEIPCRFEHQWRGIVPIVNPEIHQIQNTYLIDKPCDCGKLVYSESLCGCAIKKWEIKYNDNPDY
jgi:hypothetical protein